VDVRQRAGDDPPLVRRDVDDVPASIIGAEPDSGHIWFTLGTFLPLGSLIRVTYDGGYSTVPADLARACKLQAAVLALGEIDPAGTQFGHDPGALGKQAETILCRYQPT
jgi:hypothetical protein